MDVPNGWMPIHLSVSATAIHLMCDHQVRCNFPGDKNLSTWSKASLEVFLRAISVMEPTFTLEFVKHCCNIIHIVDEDPNLAWFFSHEHGIIHKYLCQTVSCLSEHRCCYFQMRKRRSSWSSVWHQLRGRWQCKTSRSVTACWYFQWGSSTSMNSTLFVHMQTVETEVNIVGTRFKCMKNSPQIICLLFVVM